MHVNNKKLIDHQLYFIFTLILAYHANNSLETASCSVAQQERHSEQAGYSNYRDTFVWRKRKVVKLGWASGPQLHPFLSPMHEEIMQVLISMSPQYYFQAHLGYMPSCCQEHPLSSLGCLSSSPLMDHCCQSYYQSTFKV